VTRTPSLLVVLISVAVLTQPTHASAACRRSGTQLECDFGTGRVLIGTSPAEQRPDRRAPSLLPFELDVQNVRRDPFHCRSDERNGEPDPAC
jgi:hypothetical protein